MINSTSYLIFAERVQRRIQSDWPSTEFTITNNEIYLYLFEALAKVMTAISKENYAIEGIYSTPEAFKTTYKFATSDAIRNWDDDTYEIKLPHPPLNLPLGYSIESPKLLGSGMTSIPLMAVHGFNSGYFKKMTGPDGVYYKVQGSTMIIDANGFDLKNSDLKLYVTMLSPRAATSTETDTINLSDEAMGLVFDDVIARLLPRLAVPKDLANDGVNKKTDA